MYSESTEPEAVVFLARKWGNVRPGIALTRADSFIPATELWGLGEKPFILHLPGHRGSGTQMSLELRVAETLAVCCHAQVPMAAAGWTSVLGHQPQGHFFPC